MNFDKSRIILMNAPWIFERVKFSVTDGVVRSGSEPVVLV